MVGLLRCVLAASVIGNFPDLFCGVTLVSLHFTIAEVEREREEDSAELLREPVCGSPSPVTDALVWIALHAVILEIYAALGDFGWHWRYQQYGTQRS